LGVTDVSRPRIFNNLRLLNTHLLNPAYRLAHRLWPRVPAVYLTWANPVFLAFFAFNGTSNLRAFNVAFSSIPTAPDRITHDLQMRYQGDLSLVRGGWHIALTRIRLKSEITAGLV